MSDDIASRSPANRNAVRKAQDHFSASQRREQAVRTEIEQQQIASAAKIAKLRALRLAKEESDRLSALEAASATPKSHKKTKK